MVMNELHDFMIVYHEFFVLNRKWIRDGLFWCGLESILYFGMNMIGGLVLYDCLCPNLEFWKSIWIKQCL